MKNTCFEHLSAGDLPQRMQMDGTRLRHVYYWIGTIVLLALVAAATAGPIMSRVEQPDYQIEGSDRDIEIRSYGPMIAAEALVEGERGAAIREGFRLIAAYIFGANKPNAKIAMTAPVTQQASGNAWTVRFIMPETWTIDTLPTPNDARVRLELVPSSRFVAIKFSGFATDDAIRRRTDQLRRYASEHKLTIIGEPLLAFYNPPWTLPFLRRNEIFLELAD